LPKQLSIVKAALVRVGLHLLRAYLVWIKDDPTWKDDGWPIARVCSARHGMPCWCRLRHTPSV
jgi:hypothetical protein